METGVLRSFLDVLDRHLAGHKLSEDEIKAIVADRDERSARFNAMRDDDSASEDVPYTIGNVAIVPVRGVIAPHASMVNGMSQPRGIDCATLCARLDAVAAKVSISSILLHVDSPGGAVAGIDHVVAKVREVNAIKPVVALADSCMASAAYWLASQASEIYTTPSALVGSIGVYNVVEDTSEMYAKQGIKRHIIKAGERKGGGADGVKVEQADLDEMTDVARALRAVFIADVARGRAMSPEAVLELAEGIVWVGAEAQAKGLTNGVRLPSDLVAEMQERFSLINRTGASAAAATPVNRITAAVPQGARAMKLSELKEKYPEAMKEHEEEVRAKVAEETKPEDEVPPDPEAPKADPEKKEEAAAVVPATLAELKATFPNDKLFVAEALDEGLSLPQATAKHTKALQAKVQDLEKQIAEAKADQPQARGAKPVPFSPRPQGNTANKDNDYAAAVAKIMTDEKVSKPIAMSKAAKQFPELHAAWRDDGCPAF